MPAKTEEQLAKLALARQKALEIRKANAEINRKEKELKKLEKQQRAKRVNEAYDILKNGEKPKEPEILQEEEYDDETAAEVQDEPPAEEKPKPKPKPKSKPKKKKTVVVQQDEDSSSEEEEIVYIQRPKQKKTKKIYAYKDEEPEPQPKFSAMDGNRQALFNKMFSI